MLISNNGSVESIMDMDGQKYIVDLRFFGILNFFCKISAQRFQNFSIIILDFLFSDPKNPIKHRYQLFKKNFFSENIWRPVDKPRGFISKTFCTRDFPK